MLYLKTLNRILFRGIPLTKEGEYVIGSGCKDYTLQRTMTW